MKRSQQPVDTLSYEEAFSELEKIVATLETEQATLEESMALFERGQQLSHRCGVLLEQAELKVRQLTGQENPPEPGEV